MKALIFREHGGPEVLEVVDMPVPRPGPTEVLIRVRSVSVKIKFETWKLLHSRNDGQVIPDF